MNLLDLLFPKTCVGCGKWGSYLCPTCFTKVSFQVQATCVECNKASVDGRVHPGCLQKNSVRGVCSATVYNGIMKKLLAAYKYPPYVKDMESVLVDLFYESLIQQELFMKLLQKDIVFVPIPLALKRYRTRGYNQAEELAKLLGNRVGKHVLNALERTKETKAQVNLSKEEREKNIKGAFIVSSKRKPTIDARIIVLVDDVLTTGATMNEAARVLYSAGVREVWGVTLSHGK